MIFHPLKIKDAFLLEPSKRSDNRGGFARVFCQDTISKNTKFNKPIKHINQSLTMQKGSIRGLRYQVSPALEMKIVRCLKGKAFDVMVDLRKNSDTFMQVQTNELSAENAFAVVIPEGIAHGFQTLEDHTEIMYITTEPYNKECERSVSYNDPALNINWPLQVTDISDHDNNIPHLDESFKGI